MANLEVLLDDQTADQAPDRARDRAVEEVKTFYQRSGKHQALDTLTSPNGAAFGIKCRSVYGEKHGSGTAVEGIPSVVCNSKAK